ncbi:PREDICTED: epidermis-specific secreted glycoprotein EP1-like [Nelumbo nucifera]|uniref:Epidermis-specific secreted glycoprotein EP1-like n=1 Tax=Nelumbo nucifera TaxID=4432 RepID=A0A1U8BPL0_NELNU|nr:PREDICTED: epidermis-specific secreted glycoprotein EP1-like [Nelumbo nucifera]
MSSSSPISIFFLLIFLLFFLAQAIVPPSKTFKFVNEGEFGQHYVEYYADYRLLPLAAPSPFALCFYTSVPHKYTLAMRMGVNTEGEPMRWVWEANRGNPVGEGATLTFGADGNLVLADADGRIAWQTGTANKGVVDLQVLPNGNLVLLDRRRRFVWQSFDHPTDTLFIGQLLRPGGPNKLVSRASIEDNSEGPYSLVLEEKRLALYLKSNNSANPILYYTSEDLGVQDGSLTKVAFTSSPTFKVREYELRLDIDVDNSTVHVMNTILATPKYNSTLSILRLEWDGNLRVHTYYDLSRFHAWELSLALFDRNVDIFDNTRRESECHWPSKCGSLGVCEDDQCVACPRTQGLIGWSKSCAPPALPPCKAGAKVDYYKVEGVEHWMNKYYEGDGPTKLADCKDKCSKDCGCLGFFYKEESSTCLVVPELGTLAKVSNPSHVGYIKISN